MNSEPVITGVFEWCVQFLLWLGGQLGVSYQAVNVWIFCVLWPIGTVFLLLTVILQRRKIRQLRRQLRG